jgi:hypothetical protein
MPYIKEDHRPKYNDVISAIPRIHDASELSHVVYELCARYLRECGKLNYTRVNETVGVLLCAYLEFCVRLKVPSAMLNRVFVPVPTMELHHVPRYSPSIKSMPLTDFPGDLNYVISEICAKYVYSQRQSLQSVDDVLDALECAWRGFFATYAVPYEKEKRVENGDTPGYEKLLLQKIRNKHSGKM